MACARQGGIGPVALPRHGRRTALSLPLLGLAALGWPTPAPAQAQTTGQPAAPGQPAAVPAAAANPAVAGDAPLVLGVVPNLDAHALLALYEPLRRYLERMNPPRKVRLVVPVSFKAFFDALLRGDFDLAVAAPHLARTAQLERQLAPLVVAEPRIDALLVAALDGPTTPRELQGKVVALANPQSLVAMYGVQWLRAQALEPGRNLELRGARSDLGVGRMLLTGDAAAAVLSHAEFRALPADESARLRIVTVMARIPNFIYLAHPRLDRDTQARLRTQLRGLLQDRADGADFARAAGYSGLVEPDEAMLRDLDAHVPATRRAMGLAP